MQFEKITYNDLDELKKFQPNGWTDIVTEFDFYLNSEFCNPIKTLINKKIVGIGASINFKKTSWIAHIIVDKEFRRRGIGYQIVKKLLKDLENNHVESCSLIATELGQSLYIKAGYKILTEYVSLKREKSWKNGSISKNVKPFKESHRLKIYELDNIISGENREALLTNYLNDSMVYIENNELSGYYVPSLKEGLIIADTDIAGIELMKIKYSEVDKACLPSDNIAGIEFLKDNGFVATNQKGTRMIFGRTFDWKPKKVFSRIGGNFG